MKKLTFIIAVFAILCIAATPQYCGAQTPQAIKYQAIARNSNGDLITNQNVSFRISILQGSVSGSTVYEETQSATTNQFGLANLSIGEGIVVSGIFDSIQWGNNTYFVKIEFDPKGGNNFTVMGTSQMLSVPYALYSEHAQIADHVKNTDDIHAPCALSVNTTYGGLSQDNPSTCTGEYVGAPSGLNNTGFGTNVFGTTTSTNPSGDCNTAAGYESQFNITSGSFNTGFGDSTLYNTTQEVGNTAVGYAALVNNNTAAGLPGEYNSALGFKTLYSCTGGQYNDAFGYEALYSMTTGLFNNSFGNGTLYTNVTGSSNTAVGRQALHLNTASFNCALGDSCLFTNSTGIFNTGVGTECLSLNATGSSNTALGHRALYNNIHDRNVAVGDSALFANTTGNFSTGVGTYALPANTGGGRNTAVGYFSLEDNTGASSGTAVGTFALRNSTGSFNTACGDSAGYSNTTGNYNTYLGYQSNAYAGTYTNSTAIGYNASVMASNTIQMGNLSITGFYIGTGLLASGTGTALEYTGSGQVVVSSSSRRYKKDITDLTVNSSLIYKLRPVSFVYKADSSNTPTFGLIAEEVAQVIPQLVLYAPAKNVIKGNTSDSLIPNAVHYNLLPVLLLSEVQKHEKTILAQQQVIDSLKIANENLKAASGKVQSELKDLKASNTILQNAQQKDETDIAELKKLLPSINQAQASIK